MLLRSLTLLFLLISSFGFAQVGYKGLWDGHIETAFMPVKSKYTIHVKEDENNIIKGRSYLFRDVAPYTFIGVLDFIATTYNGEVKITELLIVQSDLASYDLENYLVCIKHLYLTYSRKDSADYLTGMWRGYNDEGPCGPGKAVLRRFDENDPAKSDVPKLVLERIKQDTVTGFTFKSTELSKPAVINVKSTWITLEIRDYEKDDNDTISVFYNRSLVIDHMRIYRKVQKKTIRLDPRAGLSEIVLYAHNLGLIPPNTCLLTVDDGKTKQKVIIQSTKQKSAVVYLNFRPSR